MSASGVGALGLAERWNIPVPFASLFLIGLITCSSVAFSASLRIGSRARRRQRALAAWFVAILALLVAAALAAYVLSVLIVYVRSLNDLLDVTLAERNAPAPEDNPSRVWYVDFDVADRTARGVSVTVGVLVTAHCLIAIAWAAARTVGENVGQDEWRTRKNLETSNISLLGVRGLCKFLFTRLRKRRSEHARPDREAEPNSDKDGLPGGRSSIERPARSFSVPHSGSTVSYGNERQNSVVSSVDSEMAGLVRGDPAKDISNQNGAQGFEIYKAADEAYCQEVHVDYDGRTTVGNMNEDVNESRTGAPDAPQKLSHWTSQESQTNYRSHSYAATVGRKGVASSDGSSDLRKYVEEGEKTRIVTKYPCSVVFILVTTGILSILCFFLFSIVLSARFLTPEFVRQASTEDIADNDDILSLQFSFIDLVNLGEIACFGPQAFLDLVDARDRLAFDIINADPDEFVDGIDPDDVVDDVPLPESECAPPGSPNGPATLDILPLCVEDFGATASGLAECMTGTDPETGEPVISMSDILRAGRTVASDFTASSRASRSAVVLAISTIIVGVVTLSMWPGTLYYFGEGGGASMLWVVSVLSIIPVGVSAFALWRELGGGPLTNMFTVPAFSIDGPIAPVLDPPNVYAIAGPGPVAEIVLNVSSSALLVVLVVLMFLSATSPRESIGGIHIISRKVRL